MSGKIVPKYYTLEKRAIAQKNAATYDWAKELTKTVTERADFLLDYVDTLCDVMPSEGFPRSTAMSTWDANDDVANICPYCGVDIAKASKGGRYIVNPMENPWKVSCPECNSKFPSNDFGLLYQRGLNENGEYDVKLAYQRNQEAVARGEKDALVNELFPDKDALWMVDDGFGWSKQDGTYGTLDKSKWAPMAHYHHYFWFATKIAPNTIVSILNSLKDAYLYTGEEEYGVAGLKLLKATAKRYPAYDHKKVGLEYHASHGMGWNGKILGSIWEHFIAEAFIQVYDAFCPLMDTETNEYIKENIVREAFRGIKEGSILGNFGMQQKVAALAAVVLEDEQEVNEILDWLMQPFGVDIRDITDPMYGTVRDLRENNRGGELLDKYINEIDHDGFGGEIGITYNKEWFMNSLEIAEILSHCTYNKLDLFKNPKFVKMFDTFPHETTANGTSLAMGDSGYTVSIVYPFPSEMLRGYNVLRDPRLAQYYSFYMKGEVDGAHIDMFTDNEELVASLKKDLETYGEYQFESDNLTGFGLTVLREGQHHYDVPNQYDTWMYYGRTEPSHAHLDALQLGIDAYGMNITPDLGYPEKTAFQPNRWEWVKASISHNTVVVDGDSQVGQYSGKSYHYDSTDIVKLVDVEASNAYEQTDIYRRSAVTIAANDEIGYTLDFFRVKGGDSHMYSFHTQSLMGYTSDDVKWVPQVDEKGNYVGTYASPDFEYGHDPNSSDSIRAEKTFYPRGFTWLTHVNKGTVESGNFTVDFALTDFRNHVKDANGLHLRYTALNDWTPSSVDLTTGYAPKTVVNKPIPGLDYMFVHRTGENLDTLYTSLLQPYRNEAYIEKAESIAATVKAGTEGADDLVKALKVTLTNGLCDYVVYATNNQVTYHLADGDVAFDFRGFVGVYRVNEAGVNVYSYLNDGDILGDVTGLGTYTGTVLDFTKEFVDTNNITVQLNEALSDMQSLVGQYIYVNSDSERNTVYRIKEVSKSGENYVLHLGNTTLIERLTDKHNPSAGYVYTISEGQTFRIPVSVIKDNR